MKFNNTITHSSDCIQLYDLFSLFSLISTSFCIAFSIVGSTIYTRVGDHDDSDDECECEDEPEENTEENTEEYDHLYYDELDNLEDRVLEKEYLENISNLFI